MKLATIENHKEKKKTMKNTIVSKAAPAIIFAVVLAAAFTVRAQGIISWSADMWGFDNAVGGWADPGAAVPNTLAGVVPAYNWNDWWNQDYAYLMSATWHNLWDNSGNSTPVSITWSTFNDANHVALHMGPDADGSYNRELLNGYMNAGSGQSPSVATLTLASIPYAQYDVYVYFGSDVQDRAGTISDGTTTYDFNTMGMLAATAWTVDNTQSAVFWRTTDTTGANPEADYAVFSGETSSSVTITCNIPSWGGISGIQIVAVPEPSSLALAAMGGIGILVLGRRQTRR